MTSWRAWPATNGPAASTASGNTKVGVVFKVTSANIYLEGLWIWVADSSQSVASRKFALWVVTGSASGTYTGDVADSPTLAVGAWTFCPFNTKILLTSGTSYKIVMSGPAPNVAAGPSGYFATGPGAAGIVNGPLTIFSSTGGTLTEPAGSAQMTNTGANADPTTGYPAGSSNNNYWIDPQVTDVAPSSSNQNDLLALGIV